MDNSFTTVHMLHVNVCVYMSVYKYMSVFVTLSVSVSVCVRARWVSLAMLLSMTMKSPVMF